MATQDQSALEIANSLSPAEIPIKLRCANCNKLAVNAFKLFCCDQSICENCQASLPDTCPICAHSPLDASTSKQNKSLRLTIKAFLKSEEKKRLRDASEAQSAAAITTAPDSATPTAGATLEGTGSAPPAQVDAGVEVLGSAPASNAVVESVEQVSEAEENTTANTEIQDPVIGDITGEQEDLTFRYNGKEGDIQDIEQAEQEERAHDEQLGLKDKTEEADQTPADAGNENDNRDQAQNENGNEDQQQQNSQTMNWNNGSGLNPMMQMNGFGGFNPMMGMGGMGMNMPFGGFGGMGMNDMSGMNMNMGMGMGFGGGFGGWNGQGMNNNFGAGFYPQGGYNQQQMPQMHNQQFPNRNFQNGYRGRGPYRGYGRGRGSYGGRGGHFNQFQNQQHGYDQMNNGMAGTPPIGPSMNGESRRSSQVRSVDGRAAGSQAGQSADGSKLDAVQNVTDDNANGVNGDVTMEDNAEPDGAQTASNGPWEQNDTQHGDGEDNATHDQTAQGGGEVDVHDANGYMHDQSQNDGQWNDMNQNPGQDDWNSYNDYPAQDMGFQQQQQGFGFRGRGRGGFGRGNFHGRGGYQAYGNGNQVPAGPPAEPPINAPTGPKAMRAGLPNSGRYSRPVQTQPAETPAPQAMDETNEQPLNAAESILERGRSPSRSVSSRERKRKERDRSHSTSSAKDRRRERRHRHDKRHDDEYGEEDRHSKKIRSRSESADEDSERRQRRREKDKHRSSRSYRDSSRESRRHRHGSRSRDHETNYDDTDKHKSSRSRRDKDRKKSHRHRSRTPVRDDLARRIEASRRSRHSRDDRDPDPEPVAEADDIGFKIKGSRSAAIKAPAPSTFAPPSGPKVDRKPKDATTAQEVSIDHYAQEREARHRERMLKEQQRRESATHGKRGRDDEFDPPAGTKGEGRRKEKSRRTGHRYDDDEEERTERVERERESGRWD